MKQYWFFILMFFCQLALGSTDFNELGRNTKALESHFDFSRSPLKVVQKRWLPKKFLSELSLSLSPVLKGLNYINSYSVSASYHLFLNNSWSLNLKYSQYFNLPSQEGLKELNKGSGSPVEMKYPQKQSYIGGIEWYPFYGKAVLYNYLVHFDLYLSLLGGKTELLNLEKSVPMGSLALGLVCWWHKHFNTRWEIEGAYYSYDIDGNKTAEPIEEYLYKISVSAGVLF